MRQRQVKVVAAEDEVFADGDAVEEDLVVLRPASADERAVARAAAHVTHEDRPPGPHLRAPLRAAAENPGVNRALRLFDQGELDEPCLPCGLDRRLACDFVK